MNQTTSLNWIQGVGALLLVAAVAMVLSSHSITFDEDYYLQGDARLLQRLGFGLEYLTKMPGPTGPTYAIIHNLSAPFTQLSTPGVRLVSLAFLVFTLVAVGVTLRSRRVSKPFAWSWLMVGAPVLLIVGSLALTDMPSLFFYSAYLGMLLVTIKNPSTTSVLGASLCLSLAVMSRQSYLFALAPALWIAWWAPRLRQSLAVMVAIALIPPGLLFLHWKGLIPPVTAAVDGAPVVWMHALVAFAYAAIIQAVYDPRFLVYRRKEAIWVFLITLAIWSLVEWLTGEGDPTKIFWGGTVRQVLPSWLLIPYNVVVMSGFVSIGLLLAWELLREGYRLRHRDVSRSFLFMSAFFSLAACAKMGFFFSFRYVAPAVPALVLLASGNVQPNQGLVIRVCVGGLLGLIGLARYLQLF